MLARRGHWCGGSQSTGENPHVQADHTLSHTTTVDHGDRTPISERGEFSTALLERRVLKSWIVATIFRLYHSPQEEQLCIKKYTRNSKIQYIEFFFNRQYSFKIHIQGRSDGNLQGHSFINVPGNYLTKASIMKTDSATVVTNMKFSMVLNSFDMCMFGRRKTNFFSKDRPGNF